MIARLTLLLAPLLVTAAAPASTPGSPLLECRLGKAAAAAGAAKLRLLTRSEGPDEINYDYDPANLTALGSSRPKLTVVEYPGADAPPVIQYRTLLRGIRYPKAKQALLAAHGRTDCSSATGVSCAFKASEGAMVELSLNAHGQLALVCGY